MSKLNRVLIGCLLLSCASTYAKNSMSEQQSRPETDQQINTQLMDLPDLTKFNIVPPKTSKNSDYLSISPGETCSRREERSDKNIKLSCMVCAKEPTAHDEYTLLSTEQAVTKSFWKNYTTSPKPFGQFRYANHRDLTIQLEKGLLLNCDGYKDSDQGHQFEVSDLLSLFEKMGYTFTPKKNLKIKHSELSGPVNQRTTYER